MRLAPWTGPASSRETEQAGSARGSRRSTSVQDVASCRAGDEPSRSVGRRDHLNRRLNRRRPDAALEASSDGASGHGDLLALVARKNRGWLGFRGAV